MAKIIWCPREGEEKENGTKSEGSRTEKMEGGVDKDRGSPARARAVKEDKLEVKFEGAWFAAELTFRDGATVVQFDDYSEEEGEVWDLEGMKNLQPNIQETIRVTSAQLQDDECSKVKLKMIVCAFRKGITADNGPLPEGWFDGTVTAVRKMPHVDDECRCTFTVEWLNAQEGRREEKLKCGNICLISNKDVETHPTVVELLKRVRDAERAEAEAKRQKPSSSTPSSSKPSSSRCSPSTPTASKSRGRKRKDESDNDDEVESDNDDGDETENDIENHIDNDSDGDPDYAPNFEEQGRFPLSTQPKKAQKPKALSTPTAGRGRMRGSISSKHQFTQT